jgi:hypothetical protein
LPHTRTTPFPCFALKNGWEALKGGMARVSLFDPRLDAGSYLTKPPAGPADPGDAYESAKFGSSTCSLMIAQAAWKFAASRRAAQLMR